jgi:hypothetical protein
MFALETAPNKGFDRSAVSWFHMVFVGRFGLRQRARSTQALDPRRANRASVRLGKPSQAANVLTLFERKGRSNFVISMWSNKALDRSAVCNFHMVCTG